MSDDELQGSRRSDEIDRLVSKRLRLARLRRGLTQSDVAALVGLTYQQIQKYEAGRNRISAGRLYEFTEKLGFPVCWFFLPLDEAENNIYSDTMFLKILHTLPDDVADAIRSLINAIGEKTEL